MTERLNSPNGLTHKVSFGTVGYLSNYHGLDSQKKKKCHGLRACVLEFKYYIYFISRLNFYFEISYVGPHKIGRNLGPHINSNVKILI